MEYTRDELVAEWKMRRGLEPLRTDATIEREDALDVDEYVAREIEGRYEEMLAAGDTRLLEPVDIASRVKVVERSEEGVVTVEMPVECRRLVELRLNGWKRGARLVRDPESREARMQRSVMSRGGYEAPVAVAEEGGRWRLYRVKRGDEAVVERAMAVTREADGKYRLTAPGKERMMEG